LHSTISPFILSRKTSFIVVPPSIGKKRQKNSKRCCGKRRRNWRNLRETVKYVYSINQINRSIAQEYEAELESELKRFEREKEEWQRRRAALEDENATLKVHRYIICILA
jgi:transketolase